MSSPDPDFPSGEWTGFYLEFGSRHRQDLHLSFSNRALSGHGLDDVGRFTVRGGYDPGTRDVWWTKTYPTHDVIYKGCRDVKGIWGTWEIPGDCRGGFHIWPRCEGEERADRIEEDEALPVAVPAPVAVPETAAVPSTLAS